MMKFINILKEQEKENLTVVFAGTNGVDPMIKYWESAVLSNNDKVKFLPYTSNELSQLKEIYNVNKIIGFSGGGIKVWKEISKIPYGETRTYKDLAIAIGKPNSSRAVANACGKNPYVPQIPCHRVIRSDGKLGGYSGKGGIKKKAELLKLEQKG